MSALFAYSPGVGASITVRYLLIFNPNAVPGVSSSTGSFGFSKFLVSTYNSIGDGFLVISG